MVGWFLASIFTDSSSPHQIEVYGWPLGDIVGSISFLIILLTLFAAMRTAREAFRANALSSLPLITLSYDFSKDEVIVENQGNGDAVNIRVDKFYNWWADKDFKLYGLTRLVFKKINILKHGERQILESEVRGVIDPFGLTKFRMFSKNQKPLTFAIKFSDLSGARYMTKVRITSEKVEIISSPRRYNLWNRQKLLVMRSGEWATMLWYFLKVNTRKLKEVHIPEIKEKIT